MATGWAGVFANACADAASSDEDGCEEQGAGATAPTHNIGWSMLQAEVEARASASDGGDSPTSCPEGCLEIVKVGAARLEPVTAQGMTTKQVRDHFSEVFERLSSDRVGGSSSMAPEDLLAQQPTKSQTSRQCDQHVLDNTGGANQQRANLEILVLVCCTCAAPFGCRLAV